MGIDPIFTQIFVILSRLLRSSRSKSSDGLSEAGAVERTGPFISGLEGSSSGRGRDPAEFPGVSAVFLSPAFQRSVFWVQRSAKLKTRKHHKLPEFGRMVVFILTYFHYTPRLHQKRHVLREHAEHTLLGWKSPGEFAFLEWQNCSERTLNPRRHHGSSSFSLWR